MAQDCVTIKGTRGGLLIVLDASRDFNELRSSLVARFANARGFFRGAPFALLPTSPLSNRETAELEAICKEHGLVPGTGISLPEHYRQSRRRHRPALPHPGAGLNRPEPDGLVSPVTAATAAMAGAATGAGTTAADPVATLLQEGNLRNGQELVYSGHVTLVGNVHQGATIRAGGSIMVMGTLLGSAHAGITGTRTAVIVAYRMAPEQLSIAGVIARSPERKSERDYPEIARLDGDTIVVEPYSNRRAPC